MRVLITGAAGFIGCHLMDYLSMQDVEIVAVDNFLRGERDSTFSNLIARPNITFLDLDLSRLENVLILGSDFELIYHFAALNGTENFYQYPVHVIEASILPTLNLVNAFKESKAQLILASTPEVYAGSLSKGLVNIPTSEVKSLTIEDISNPRWSYAASKLLCENLLYSAKEQYGMKFQIQRLHNVYGTRMGDRHFLPEFVKRAIHGDYRVLGGNETRSFLYVQDAVRMIQGCAESNKGVDEIINIGSSDEIKVIDAAQTILQELGIEDKPYSVDSLPGSTIRRQADLTKMKYIGIEVDNLVPWHEGVRKYINWRAATKA